MINDLDTQYYREVEMIDPQSGTALVEDRSNPMAVGTPGFNSPSPSPEYIVLGSMLQSMQSVQQQQLLVLRDMDVRVAKLETGVNNQPQPASFERGTWWALWGLLMLIMGSALAIITILIVVQNMPIFFR